MKKPTLSERIAVVLDFYKIENYIPFPAGGETEIAFSAKSELKPMLKAISDLGIEYSLVRSNAGSYMYSFKKGARCYLVNMSTVRTPFLVSDDINNLIHLLRQFCEYDEVGGLSRLSLHYGGVYVNVHDLYLVLKSIYLKKKQVDKLCANSIDILTSWDVLYSSTLFKDSMRDNFSFINN